VAGRRALVLHQTANLLSGVANALVMVAIPWLILDRTGSASAAGLAGALAGLPGIVVAPVVGALVDRLGRRTVSVGSDLFSTVSVALFPLADAAGRLDLGVILALTLLGAVFDPAGYTARKSLIPDVAAAAGVRVDQVNGVHEGVMAAGWVVGPMLAALAIAAVGPVATMWFACGAFLVAVAAIALLPVPNRSRAAHGAAPSRTEGRFWSEVLDGVRALAADRPVMILTVAIAVVSMIYMPTESVLLPVHYESLDEPGAFGLVLSALAAGAMLGAFAYGWVAARMRRSRIATVFLTLACVAYVPLAFLPSTFVMAVAAFALGLAWGPMSPLLNSLVQHRFPADRHGRVYGVQLAIFYAAPPLGQLLAGVAVAELGVQPVIAAVAVGMVATALIVNLQPSLRGLDGAPVRVAPAPDR
jgi:MFS family permease